MSKSQTLAWVIAGFAGGVLLIGVAGLMFGISYWSSRQTRQLEIDPAKRTEEAKRLLGADALPGGYHAMSVTSVPLVMEIGVLTDRAPDADGRVDGFDESGFLFIEFKNFGPVKSEMRDFFEGRSTEPDTLRDNSVAIEIREILGRGTLERDDDELLYVAFRGSAGTRSYSGKGIVALMMIDCAADSRSRVGVWFAPDPSPDTPAEQLDLIRTPADEDELQRFMRSFRFCDSVARDP